MRVLLSIKPKYVKQIFDGSKMYEFRKVIFKNPAVQEVLIYSSHPVKRIVGTFRIGKILKDNPENVWMKVHSASGISEEEFFGYFSGKDLAYAIKIEDLSLFDEPVDPKKHNADFIAPQSFQYVDKNHFSFFASEVATEC